jgi:ABC-type Na+ transport system ATPase subunit NatA
VCTRIVIIDHGRAIADGTAEDIAARTGKTSLESAFVALTGQRDAAEVTQDLLNALGR